MKSMKMALAAAFIAGTSVALAAERTISQKGKAFSESEVALKKGDALVFLNDDNVVHNVLSTTPGNQFNLGSIGPGHSTPVTFDKAGNIQVLCAIHPTMKMLVKVSD
jgi:plastocyanin